MDNDRRKNERKCPKCGYHILGIYNDYLTCLSPACDWKVQAKREEDKQYPTYEELRKLWES